jgi:hypothetical protein
MILYLSPLLGIYKGFFIPSISLAYPNLLGTKGYVAVVVFIPSISELAYSWKGA